MAKTKTEDFRNVLETVFLFLKNNNFKESADTLRKECKIQDISLSNISGKVMYKCSQKGPSQDKDSLRDKRIMLYTFLEKVEDITMGNDEMHNDDDVRNKFRQLQEDYKSLLDVTFELTNLLQLNLEEQAKNVHLVVTQCEFLHPSLFQPLKNKQVNGFYEASKTSDRSTNTSDRTDNNLEKYTEYKKESCINMDIAVTVPPSPINYRPHSEVKNILENVIGNVLKIETDTGQNTPRENIQEIRLLLEDILQEVMVSPRELPVEENSFDSTVTTATDETSFYILSNTTTDYDKELELNLTETANDPINEHPRINEENLEHEKVQENKKHIDKGDTVEEVPTHFKPEHDNTKPKKKEFSKVKLMKARRNTLKFPNTPLCYLEVCRKVKDGCCNTCKCMKCIPNQSRYYCSCFDLICKDLDEEPGSQKCNKNTVKNVQDREKCAPESKERKKTNDICSICEGKKCKCAFQSRPKIGRSPPTT